MNTIEEQARKIKEKRDRKNALQRERRANMGDEWRERNRIAQLEFRKKEREILKKEDEEAGKKEEERIKKEIKKTGVKKEVKKEVKVKFKDLPIVRTEKDRGELKSRAERLGEKGVSEKTAKDYIGKISVIHKVLAKDDLEKELLEKILLGNGTDKDEYKILENMEYIKDVDNLIETITKKYENIQSRKGYISPFLTLTSYLKCLNKINYDKLRLKFEEVNNEIYGIRKENKQPENENLIDDFKEKTIIELSKKLGKDRDYILIYYFYSLQPPRRNDDVVKLEIIYEGYDKNKLDKKKNYLVIDENKNAKELIYLNYKTKESYGKQIIPIENEKIKEEIKYNIIKYNKKEGDRLFHSKTIDKKTGERKLITAYSFGRTIAKIFTKIYGTKNGKNTTLNTIRHSYITWEMREVRNVRYLENLALLMGHSPNEAMLYRRI